MNILQINDQDSAGRRFNGYDLNIALEDIGDTANQLVFEKYSQSKNVHEITKDRWLRDVCVDIERKNAIHSLLSPYGTMIMDTDLFKRADIVHYHLIHNHMISLLDFPEMTQSKPSVWTWHDPWAVTGHCVHPKDCLGWRTGCEPCPHLTEYFPLRRDTAGQLWRIKKKIYGKMDVDIVVSSQFMLDFAKESQLGQCFPRVHRIPFGIQTANFARVTREEARIKLDIPLDDFVIAFRCETNEYKGTDYIYTMLKRLQDTTHITLLTVGFSKLPPGIQKGFHTVELGWQDDIDMLTAFYAACDIFLMPSIAESFGLMAIEAMASSRPIIVFEGTALPSVTHAPECGISVPKGDVSALLAAVTRLQNDPLERQTRGALGRTIAEKEYQFSDYVRRHKELYSDVMERKLHEAH